MKVVEESLMGGKSSKRSRTDRTLSENMDRHKIVCTLRCFAEKKRSTDGKRDC